MKHLTSQSGPAQEEILRAELLAVIAEINVPGRPEQLSQKSFTLLKDLLNAMGVDHAEYTSPIHGPAILILPGEGSNLNREALTLFVSRGTFLSTISAKRTVYNAEENVFYLTARQTMWGRFSRTDQKISDAIIAGKIEHR